MPVLDELLPAMVQSLPELGVGGVMFTFAMWRERVHAATIARLTEERATLISERTEAVAAARASWAEDDERTRARCGSLADENARLELALDEERRRRRAAEDGPGTLPSTGPLYPPRHHRRADG